MTALAAAVFSAGLLAQVVATPPPVRPVAPPVPGTPPPTQGRANQPVKPFVSTGLILGRVVDASTGRPVSGAVVALTGGPQRVQAPAIPGQPPQSPAPQPQLLTDSEGRFAFRFLARGNYQVSASKPGFSPGAFGRA